MDKLYISWDEAYQLSLKLAAQIAASGQQFDYLVVVPRGGYFPGNIVARQLGYGITKLLHACVGSYDAGVDKQGSLVIGELPAAKTVHGKQLLIIDEICDTGETLSYLVDYFNKHGAKVVKSAVLHYKPERSQTGYLPDWSVESTDKWLVYPWEITPDGQIT